MLLEDMLVIDAATIYPRYNRGGSLYALDVIDGATIKPLIGEDGRAPEPPDPAYQQILKGIPAADFSAEELLYLPRNLRAHRLYGMSPVEQIALTVNIALRRDAATLDYYQRGLDAGRLRHPAQGMDGRPDPLVPGLFRRADERQSGAPTPDQVRAGRLQADRGPPAAAQGPVRRVARTHHLLRLLGARLAVREPGQPRDERDLAPAGDGGGPGAAQGVGEERPRPCDPELHERTLGSNSCGSGTTRSIRWSSRRRCRSWSAPTSRPARRRGRIWASGRRRAGRGRQADDNASKALPKFNPHHSRPTGQFMSADDPDAQPAERLA